jgi:hypothetical protein
MGVAMSVVFPKPDASDGWKPVTPATPGVSEWNKVVKNSDGSTDTFTQKWVQSSNTRILSKQHVVETVASGATTTTTDFNETTVSAHGQAFTTSQHDVTVETEPGNKTWETTDTDSQGQVTTQHGVVQENLYKTVGLPIDLSGTETVNTINPDGSVLSQTITWSNSADGTRHTELVDKNGNIIRSSDGPVWMARDGSWQDKPAPASGDSPAGSEQGDPGLGDAEPGAFGPDGPVVDPGDDPGQSGAESDGEAPTSSGSESEGTGSSEGSADGTGSGESSGEGEGSGEGSGSGEGAGPGESGEGFIHAM